MTEVSEADVIRSKILFYKQLLEAFERDGAHKTVKQQAIQKKAELEQQLDKLESSDVENSNTL